MSETTKIEKVNGYIRLHPFRSFLLGLVLIFLPIPILILPAITHFLDFSTTGQIGDTIGGITAPILGLIGIWLVYITFEEQRRANKIQNDALEEQRKDTQSDKELKLIFELYGQARDEINLLIFRVNSNDLRAGVAALARFGESVKAEKDSHERGNQQQRFDLVCARWRNSWNIEESTIAIKSGVRLVASTFLMLAKQISNSKSITPEERQAHNERAQTLFNSYCGRPFKQIRDTLTYFKVDDDFAKLIIATETAFANEALLRTEPEAGTEGV
jgi:hypothetical protein